MKQLFQLDPLSVMAPDFSPPIFPKEGKLLVRLKDDSLSWDHIEGPSGQEKGVVAGALLH